METGCASKLQNSTSTHNIVWDGQAYLLETVQTGANGVITEVYYTQEPTPFGGLISQSSQGQIEE